MLLCGFRSCANVSSASLWMTRATFAAALIAFSTLPTSAFADRDDDAKSDRKAHRSEGLVLTNARIYTMDGSNRVVDEVLVKNGRFVEVGKKVDQSGKAPVFDARGRTVIPGIIDAHVHVVLVGNRPGWHTPMEHVFTIPDAIAAYQARVADVPPGEFITTIGPIAARQFAEQRLPTLAELDAVGRPVYIQAAQGGTRANSAARAWFMANAPGVSVADSGAVTGPALQALRSQLLTAETRKRTAYESLQYFATLGITTHRDAGAFHSELPSNGIANENTYTMHFPFLALQRERNMPVRLRIDFLHQDPATDPTLPTLAPRLRNSFPFFGDDWLRTGGIGEFTGGGVNGLRAIAAAGWRGEDHSLNLSSFLSLVDNRQIVHDEIVAAGNPDGISKLRWVISHVPQVTEAAVNKFKAMGGGLLVGWGPTRTGTNIGPAYRTLFDNGIPLGYHSDGGDITVINPWLNFYTMITGRNLSGDLVSEGQTLTRWETLWLATAANKWFIWEDDVGSIEVGNHADFVVLDRDFFSVADAEIPRIRSVLTVIGGKIVHDAGVLQVRQH
jgi:predicted amidohydrolase YtcJ